MWCGFGGVALAAAIFVPAITGAIAQETGPAIVDATGAEALAAIVRDLGYGATVTTDGQGDPLIRTKVSGVDTQIYFYRCTDNANCRLLVFVASFGREVDLETVNEWNAGTLLGRAYAEPGGSAALEFGVNMDGGVTETNFRDTFDWWDVIVADFKDAID